MHILSAIFTSATLLIGTPELGDAMADAMVTEDLSEAASTLEAAIAAVRADPQPLPPQLLASLALLASLYIALDDRSRAGKVLDTLVHVDPYGRAPVQDYGPQLLELYEARRDALLARGQAQLELSCHGPCEIILDGHRHVAPLSAALLMGTHVLWLRASEAPTPNWERREIVFTRAGQTEILEFGEPPAREQSAVGEPLPLTTEKQPPLPEVPPSAEPAPSLTSFDSSPPSRFLPRALEVSGLVVGVTALVTGVVMLVANGRCKSNWRPANTSMSPAECPVLFNTDQAGFGALAGIGGALAIASSVTLAVDNSRVAGSRATQLSLSYRFAF